MLFNRRTWTTLLSVLYFNVMYLFFFILIDYFDADRVRTNWVYLLSLGHHYAVKECFICHWRSWCIHEQGPVKMCRTMINTVIKLVWCWHYLWLSTFFPLIIIPYGKRIFIICMKGTMTRKRKRKILPEFGKSLEPGSYVQSKNELGWYFRWPKKKEQKYVYTFLLPIPLSTK